MAQDTVVIEQNQELLEDFKRIEGAPAPLAYLGAMVHLAIFGR